MNFLLFYRIISRQCCFSPPSFRSHNIHTFAKWQKSVLANIFLVFGQYLMFLLWRRQQQQHQLQWRYFRPFNSINYSAIVTDIHFTILYIVIKRSATSKFGARNRSAGTNQLWRSSLLLSEAVSHLFSK